MHHSPLGGALRFSVFEVDMRSGELHKRGVRVPLQQQPFRILIRLLERPGEVVTREELHQELWPADTFVDFEQGLNGAVKRLREALGDSAETPRFVETLPKRGYRFIAPLDSPNPVTLERNSSRQQRDIGDDRLEIISEDPLPASEMSASIPRAIRGKESTAVLLSHAGIGRPPWLVAALSLTAVLVTVLVAVMYYRETKQKEDLREAAEGIFYDLRALEGNLVRLRRLQPRSSELSEASYRRDKLSQAYDGYVERLGWYDGRSQTERAVMRMARRLGEADLDVPEDFYKLTMVYVQRWGRTSRLQSAITRARERNLIHRIKNALDERGLPKELMVLVLQESNFDTSRVGPHTRWGSPKGLWQITPELAHRYGLIVGPLSDLPQFDSSDERHDEDRSTEAATNYLADLYSSNAAASTLLVMASYNVGEGAVRERLDQLPRDPRDRNFWNFYKNSWLPEATRDYVMSIFSAALICEQPEVFNFSLEKIW